MVAEMTHTYEAQERQAEVLGLIAEAPEGSTTFIGYGGAAGGAKTNLIANLALEIALQCPGSHTLVGREDLVDLKETTLAEFDAAIPPGLEVRKYDSAPIYRDIRADSTKPFSRVWFKHLKDDPGSTQYGWVLIDEGSEVALQRALYLITRLRHLPEKKWGMVIGFNPFPGWCVDWFMRGQTPDLSKVTNTRIDFHFVRSRMEDNKHLRAGYKELQEATLDPYLRAVMVDGDPDAALGGLLYFDRQVIEDIAKLCVSPARTIDTRPEPGAIPDGVVEIWEGPIAGEQYYVGADTADGKGEALLLQKEKGGSDRNSAAFYRASDNVQVAAIYGRQEEHVYAGLLNEWGRHYHNAYMCVERNRRPVLSNLLALRYPSLFLMPQSGDMHVVPVANMQRQLEYGYVTNTKTRPVLLSNFRETLHAHVMKPRDKRFATEALNFLAGEKPEASAGQHDDTVFAHALADQARRAMRLGWGGSQQRRAPTQQSSTLRIG